MIIIAIIYLWCGARDDMLLLLHNLKALSEGQLHNAFLEGWRNGASGESTENRGHHGQNEVIKNQFMHNKSQRCGDGDAALWLACRIPVIVIISELYSVIFLGSVCIFLNP